MRNPKKVIIKRPGERPYSTHISMIDANIRSIVGGDFEFFSATDKEGFLVNATGGEPNFSYLGCEIKGTVILCSYSEDCYENVTYSSLTRSFGEYKTLFPEMFKN